jgi:tetratricopeptide (TPR) repeat protein
MQRPFLGFAVVFLGCLATSANLDAQDAADYVDRGLAWQKKGEYDKAIADYDQALAINPEDARACCCRGAAWRAKGEYDKAIADFNRALAINPQFASAHNGRGAAWYGKGEYDKALADLNEAIRLKPNEVSAYYGRAMVWYDKGEYDKAMDDCNEAIRLRPKDAGAYGCRGILWRIKGEYNKALADFNQALAITPNLALGYNAVAWLQATCPDEKYRDGKKAIENATKAYHLSTGKWWGYAGTLAAAYAESGDFEKAKEWEAKAVELATTDKSAKDKDKRELRSRLELYQQGKPYREEPKKKQGGLNR